MFPRSMLPLLALLAACSVPATENSLAQGWQSFSLGGSSAEHGPTADRRFIVSVPVRYIDTRWLPDPLLKDQSGRILANAIRFAVTPTFEPAEEPWSKNAIRLTIGAYREDGISRSLDGSWPNYYSGFKINLRDQYGLKVRARADRDPLDRRVFFRISAEEQIRIECTTNLGDHRRWCVMIAKRPLEPTVETGFDFAVLPHWRERLHKLRLLFRSEGKLPPGEAVKTS
ncbi:hypothetical protein ACQEPB_01305 [Novosphingobium fluoreni]|uniref:hypothetical protein n=1 Tax=Novosphingobium fluoreni TaxID=1391222 RepID=UPI003DA18E56